MFKDCMDKKMKQLFLNVKEQLAAVDKLDK